MATKKVSNYGHIYTPSIPTDVDKMSGLEFENFCADLLKNLEYDYVTITKQGGDQGADIIAVKNKIKLAIQCKCYSEPVGNSAIMEISAGRSYYGCHVGIVLTNNYFTSSAKELAEKSGIVLWDRDDLNRMIKNSGIQLDKETKGEKTKSGKTGNLSFFTLYDPMK